MKKIDLHIHTVSTISDIDFSFSLEKLRTYVSNAKIDAISITNHDVFDSDQYRMINEAVDAIVFPGIEVNVETGHVLIISDSENLDDFESKTLLVSQKITEIGDRVTVDELKEIFGDLNDYLVIPHYDKKPAIKGEVLERILSYVSAGEVDSAKKFIRGIKDASRLTPVLFSDARICDGMTRFPTRQTFVNCGELTLQALKACFRDKSKVALTEAGGNSLFQIFDDGQKLSTGLNILLGERSTGKTFTLNRINDSSENVKYIRQFSLVQQDEAAYEKEFQRDISRKRSQFTEKYLGDFKVVLNDVVNVDLQRNERLVDNYISTLLRSAEEAERKDSFSKTALFDETKFTTSKDRVLSELIGSVRQLIENKEYRSIIDKHLDKDSLRELACELIETLWRKDGERKKRKFVNGIVRDVRERLRLRTSATQVEDVDLYRISMDLKKVERFEEITRCLQKKAVISEENVQGFSVVANKAPFAGPGEVKSASGLKVAFSDSYKEYKKPYNYLRSLKSNESLTPSEFYKYFVKTDYKILNRDGYEVSGGERSEFRLLQEIKDAQNYDILLIDEPESSFDNMFLKGEVNQIIKEISLTMPVVVVTHNSTVGASIGADYLLYASKELGESGVEYRLYSGHPMDRELSSLDGKQVGNFELTLNSLEAGDQAYNERRLGYEDIKDRG